MCAPAYALKYPASVSRLVLANTVASGKELQAAQSRYNGELRDQMPEVWARVQKLRARGVRSDALEHQAAYGVPPTLYYFYNPENASRLRALSEAEPLLYNPDLWYALAGLDADFRVSGELGRFDVRGRLKQFQTPVLILAGRFDRNTYPALTLRYKTYLPRAEFVMLERSGHFPFIEEADRTLEVLRKFLAG